MSFVPLIELKGGIVFARGVGLGFFESLGLAFVGSTLVFFLVFFLLVPILNLLKKIKFVAKLAFKAENYVKVKAQDALEKNNGKGKALSEMAFKQLAVFIFVAIPLPMTGVWTGTAIAVFLDIKFKDAILPVVLGNLVAGMLISILAEVCLTLWSIAVLDYILYALFGIALILLIVLIVKVSKQKPNEQAVDKMEGEN
jgi:uncharacterized membrane protein